MKLSRGMIAAVLAATAACGRHKVNTPTPALSGAALDSVWNRAEAAFHRSDWGEAQKLLDRAGPLLQLNDPKYSRLHFYQAEILFAQGTPLQAVREFRRVADERPDDPLAPEALLRAGDAYADLWRRAELDPTYGETARTVYQEVLSRYEGSPSAARATLRLSELADKFATKEYQNALFYFKFKAYDSAILLFRGLIASYPKAAVVPDALEHLVRAYRALNYQEDMKETCAYIAQYHPGAKDARRYCPASVPAGGEKP